MRATVPMLLFSFAVFFATASSVLGEDADLSRLFSDRHVTGTLVIANMEGTKVFIHNDKRAATPFIPASTFKIPNTLIALESKVITEEATLKWDGKDRGVKEWNRDQTLDSAFRTSCVWFYQEVAGRIGTEAYREYLEKIEYGNAKPTPEVTTFWLDGDLRISALEQITFLKKVYRRKLPFRSSSFDTLNRIMIVERTSRYTLRAKTGWAQRVTPQIGWYVGYVEYRDTAWFFALNMEIANPQEARLRQEIALEGLRLKGILD